MSGDWPSESGARSQKPRSYRAPDSASFPGGQPPVPPDWDDPEEEFPAGAEEQDAAVSAELSEVSAYLASVPAPVLPDAVEARISAALAAEVIARAGGLPQPGEAAPTAVPAPGAAGAGADAAADAATSVGEAVPAEGVTPIDSAVPADDAAPVDGNTPAHGAAPAGGGAPAGGARTLGPAPARARVRRRRGGGERRGLRSRPLAVWSLAACLVLAGIVYGLSRVGSPGSSSSFAAGSAASAAGSSSGESQAMAAPEASAPAATPSRAAGAASFAVTASGTRYQAATLAAQVRARLAIVPAQGGAPVRHGSAPTPALQACVAQVTGGAFPRLVDRATYQGEPAYIIASSSHVWVVGLGCTAAHPELIKSVPLVG